MQLGKVAKMQHCIFKVHSPLHDTLCNNLLIRGANLELALGIDANPHKHVIAYAAKS